MLKQLINLFIKKNGRSPNALEMLQLKFKAAQQSGKGEVIQFPRDKITDWTKARPQPSEVKTIDGIKTTRGMGDLFGRQLEKARKKTKATPKVVERSMSADNYYNFKEEWFGRIIANTDDDINTFLKKGINQADKRFVTLSKDQRKDFLDMVEYRLKHGNEKFMNDSEMFFKKNGRKPHEYGGLAGMLGEPTYQDEEHRVPYKDGEFGKKEDLPSGLKAEVGDPTPGWGLSDLVSRYFLYQKVIPGVGEETKKYLGEKFLNDLNAQGYSPKDFKAYIDEQFPESRADGGRIGFGNGKKVNKKIMKGSPLDWWELIGDELDPDEWEDILKSVGALSYQTGGRVGFSAGGIDKMRRLFLQATGAGAATVGAAKSGLFGLLKGSKSAAVKDLTQIPIQSAEGMPSWFKPLVNRVIKEGKDITNLPVNKGGAFLDRQIVHSAKLGEGQGVRVYQNLDDQTIRVEYQSADNMGGVDDGIVHLEYKAPQVIEGPIKKGKSTKTEAEFSASEAYPYQDPKDYKYVTFESDNTVKNVDGLYSDTSALKQFGTNKALTNKELEIAKQKRQQVKKINEDPSEELAGSGPDYDYPFDYDYASGGRVSFKGGGKGKVLEGLAKLFDEFFPETTKVGKTSKPMAEKTQVRKAIADFKEREKAAKIREAMSKAESKMAGPIKTQNKGFWDPESTDHTAFLLQEEFFRPDAKDFLGQKVPSNWIALEREKAKNTLKELGPLPSRRHPNWEGMRQIRQGVKNRLVALDITEELGGNVAMFDYLRTTRGSPEKFLNINNYIKKADAPVVKDELSGIKKAFIQKQAQKEGDPSWIKQGKAITEENFSTSQFAPRDDVIATRAYAGKVEDLRKEFPGISDDLIKNILVDDNPQRVAEVKATLKEALKMQEKGMGPDEIINIFKKQGKKPTKHATGGLAGMLGE